MRLQRIIMQFCIVSLTVLLLTACQSSDSDSDSGSSALSVAPSSLSLAMGASSRLTATVNNTDVTSSATWSSSNSGIALVSNSTTNTNYPKGTVTAVRTGSATITVTYNGQSATSAITVTSAKLNSVQVTPIYPSLALAATPEVQFTATGVYSDGTKLDLSEYVTWSSSSTSVAAVNNTTGKGGLVSTIAAGSTTIKAIYEYPTGDVSGDTALTLTSDSVDSLEVTPINPSIANNTTLPFNATILVTDGTTKKTQSVTGNTIWSSGTIATAPISNATGSMGKATAIATGTSSINGTFGSTSATASTLTVTAATLSKLQIFPAAPSIAAGVDLQLTAKGIYLTGAVYTHQDLTGTVVWSSSDTTVATVCNSTACKGKISAIAAGTATITASMPGSITKAITLTVNADGQTLTQIQVTPTNPSVYSGTSQKFKATGIYYNGTSYFHQDITEKVVWSSSSETVAKVSNAAGSAGTVKNRAAGTTTITATHGLVSGTSALTVLASTMALSAIEVSPANPSIAEGMKQQFTAIGVFSDGTTTILKDITDEVIWTSGTTATARISNTVGSKGEAVAITLAATGTSTIAATLGSTSGTSILTVFETDTSFPFTSLEITPELTTVTIAVGASQQLEAIGIFYNAGDAKKKNLTDHVTWISSDPTVANVDNLNGTSGLLRGLKAGSATITASWTDGAGTPVTKSATKTVTVNSMTLQSMQITPSSASLDLGMTQQYKTLGIYSDGSTYMVNHLPTDLSWLSADSTTSSTINAPIGSDDAHHGLATVLAAGTSTISAKFGAATATETLTTSDVTLQSITIYPASPTIANGTKVQFRASGSYSDNLNRDITHLVRWSSGTAATALIKNSPADKGLATSVAAGTSAISAALGSISGSTTLTVKASTMNATGVQVTPATPVMGAGTTLQLAATGIFTAGSNSSMDLTKLVYWTTSNSAVATVSNADSTNGRVYGVAAGTATLTAYWTGSVVASGTATVTVTSGTLASIQISPDQPFGPVGYTEQLKATALYSDNNTQDVTESVVWTSSDKTIVTVSNVEGSRGEITRVSYGSATITARLGSSSTTATVTVW